LIEISNSSKEDVVMAEAKGLCKNALEDFEFLISLCIWYKILDKVNWISQVLRVRLAPHWHGAKQRFEPKSQNWMSLGQRFIRICDFKNVKF
jgi:hypothetical protein